MPDRFTVTATIIAADAVPIVGVDELIGAHGGRQLSASDGRLVASFDASSQALRAAVELQRLADGRRNGAAPRVGVAAGDVTWQGNECFGTPIVTAERLRAAAGSGQIVVTGPVRVLAGDRVGVGYEPLGWVSLADVDEVVESWVVGWDRSSTDAAQSGPPPIARALAGSAGPPFVGRSDVLNALSTEWTDAGVDTGRIVLIGGEAGTGKTRLAAELARRLHGAGAAVLYGTCDDDLALPYQPWVQALDPVVPALVAADRQLAASLTPLVALLRSAERFVSLASGRAGDDAEAERYRRYSAFAQVLDAATSTWPTLLVLDDLHWAGAQTLALLRHLPRLGLPRRLLIVATFRDTGDEITEPLASLLADLRRVDGARRLRLGGLDTDSVERFVAAAAGGSLDADLREVARVLAERTDGNPFYVGALWDHLVARGAVVAHDGRFSVRSVAAAGDVPDSVREVITARLGRLSPVARRVVDLAAIAGMEVESAVLELAAGTDGLTAAEVVAGTDELCGAGLLAAVGGARPAYRFSHAIVRDTVAMAVASSGRARLHLAVGRGLEAVHEPDPRPVLAELARHFKAAVPVGPIDRAVQYGRRAASQAFRAAAYDEAFAQLMAVLELPLEPTDRAELLVDLGLAHLRDGFYEQSRRTYREAFDLAEQAGAVDAAAAAAVGFELATHFPGLPGDAAVELLGRAIELAVESPVVVRTRLRASFGRALVVAGRAAAGLAMSESTIVDARAINDPESLTVALQAVVTGLADPARRLELSTELAELADATGDTWGACYASANLVRALVQLGQFDDAAEALDRHRQLSAPGRFATYQFMTTAFEAILEMAAGRFDEAEAAAARGQELAAANDSPFGEGVYGLQMFALRRAQGRLHEVAPAVHLLARSGDDNSVWRPGLAALYVELGMIDEARAVFEQLLPDRFAAVPRDAIWPACLTFLAEAGLVVADAAALRILYEELVPWSGQTLVVGFTTCFGPADRMLGALAARLGRLDDAERHFTTAVDVATRCHSPVWIAEVERERAGAGRAEPAPATFPDHLSEREVEVLRYVATGLSNREIGAQLFISQNTVANHVRAILRKTGCANRTEAAGYAMRHGLLEF